MLNWNRGRGAIKTLILAAVIAALHAPIAWVAPVSIAGAVDDSDDHAELRAGIALDERVPGVHEFDLSRDSTGAGLVPSGAFDPRHYRNPALGISFAIHGAAFTFDEAVAGSYRIGLASDAASDEDDLPSSADRSDFSAARRNVVRASLNFNDHMKSVADSRFSSPQLMQVDEWNARDFRPPEWMTKLRDAVRANSRELKPDPDPSFPETPHPGAPDAQSLLRESLKFLSSLQAQIEAIDPLFLVLMGVVSLPVSLLGFALIMRYQRAPLRASRRGTPTRSQPVTRVRRRRKRSRSSRIRTEAQNS